MSDVPLSATKEPATKIKKKTPFWKELLFAHLFILLSAPITFFIQVAPVLARLIYTYAFSPNPFPSLHVSQYETLYLGAPYTSLLFVDYRYMTYLIMYIFIWAAQIALYFYSLKYAFSDHKMFSNIWVRRYLAACIGGFAGYLVIYGIFDHFFIYHKYNRVPF